MTERSIAGDRRERLAVARPGYWLVRDDWPHPATRDRVAAAHLDPAELSALASLPAPARDDRLRGRLAAKEAVLTWLAERGIRGVEPRDVHVGNDAAGRPRVRIGGRRGLVGAPAVSVAHRRPAAVAAVGPPGQATGIDLELVEPRGSVFTRLALTARELGLGERGGIGRDEWVTRVWTIKEAVAKSAGTGLRGRPKDFVVREIDGDWARATGPDAPQGLWVRSSREGDLVVSVVARRDDGPSDA
jgi:phosphopantetheinyl transferase (holo-ACP synthase)